MLTFWIHKHIKNVPNIHNVKNKIITQDYSSAAVAVAICTM